MIAVIDGVEEKVKSIVIFGRRWWSKSSGTTYCTAEIYLNGVFYAKTPKESKYGDYYLQCANEYLKALTSDYAMNCNTSDIERVHNLRIAYRVADVCREVDL